MFPLVTIIYLGDQFGLMDGHHDVPHYGLLLAGVAGLPHRVIEVARNISTRIMKKVLIYIVEVLIVLFLLLVAEVKDVKFFLVQASSLADERLKVPSQNINCCKQIFSIFSVDTSFSSYFSSKQCCVLSFTVYTKYRVLFCIQVNSKRLTENMGILIDCHLVL